MCTGFVYKGADLIVGYNLDLAIGVWDYRVYKKKDMFYIGIKVGSTIYKTHGVNRNGNFGSLPYMNDPEKGTYRRGAAFQRIDLMVDRYIAGKHTYDETLETVQTKQIVNVPNASMHALFSDRSGRVLMVEPGLGYREETGKYAVVTNFPLLERVDDLSPVWYGKERYDQAVKRLKQADDGFSPLDGLRLLEQTRQTGEWATRVSFVYSRNENAVYYVENNDFTHVTKHAFAAN